MKDHSLHIGAQFFYFLEKVTPDACWRTGRNSSSRPGGKRGQAESRCCTCRGPEAHRVEGAAEEAGKGLKGQAKELRLDSGGTEGS